MKKLIVMLCALVLAAGVCFAADPCEGYWLSVDEESGKTTAIWNIYVENDVLYGKIIHVPGQNDSTIAKDCKDSYKGFPVSGKVNQMTVVNTPFIFNLKNLGTGKWGKGNIIDPGNGSMYTCTMTFHAADGGKYKKDTLEMKGSIGPIGRSQYWLKTSKEEAETLK